MWRKSFIFLVVLVFAVSSAFCYPYWMYGKKASPLVTEQMPSEAPEVEENLEQAGQKLPSRKAEKLQTGDSKDSLKGLKAFVTESIEDEVLLEVISEYIKTVEDGIEVMQKAYDAEVEYSKSVERKYNALADAYVEDAGKAYEPHRFVDDFSVTFSPFATYSHETQEFGVGGQIGLGWKNVSINVGAIKPAVHGLGDLKAFDDLMVTAGVALTF